MVVLGLGMAISVAPLTTTVMNAVDVRHAGAASGINNAVSRAAGLLAVALMSVLVLHVFTRELDRRLVAMGVGREVAAALDAERVKLAAAEAPPSFPASDRIAVQRAVSLAFASGFRCMAMVAAGLALAAALTAAAMISGGLPRGVRPTAAGSRS
jgi:hypothetical protein